MVEQEFAKQSTLQERQHKAQERRKARLLEERAKLLQAHYKDAVPVDLLKSEQIRTARELQVAEELIAASTTRHAQVRINLAAAVAQAERWHLNYQAADPDMRRDINQSVFEKILIHQNGPATGEMAEPFVTLLSDEVTLATIDKVLEDDTEPSWINCQLKKLYERERGIAWPTMPRKPQTPPLVRRGLSNELLVPGTGLEPVRELPLRGV